MFYAFGDSFVAGDQDEESILETHCYGKELERTRYEVSFASYIAKYLNTSLENFAIPGSGNYPQLDILTQKILLGEITKNDYIFFGLTAFYRDRASLQDTRVIDNSYGPCLADRTIFSKNNFSMEILDYNYILAILDFFNKYFEINIKCMHMFHIPINDLGFKKDVGYNTLISNNMTFFDILNDNKLSKYHKNHSLQNISVAHKHLYTPRRHPSIEGHKKIANWLITNVYGKSLCI